MDFVAEHINLSFFSIQLFLWSPIFLTVYIVYEYWTNPLSQIPSVHWSAPWSSCFILWQIYHGKRSHAHYAGHTKIATKILPVIRIAPKEVSLMSSSGIQAVYGKGFDRSTYYGVFRNFGSPNMFCFASSKEHSIRKRLVAPAYSKLSISSLRTQSIIERTLQKLVIFLGNQADGSPLIARNIFRALVTDVFTAFAFSEMEGTVFLDGLKEGPNSMKELGMDVFQLWHEDIRSSFFFFESEFKCVSHILAPHCRQIHGRLEAWISDIINRYEAQVEDRLEDENSSRRGVYWRLLAGKNSPPVENLRWRERASEIMDQMGASHDTVACVLECIMQQLTLHLTCQSRLRQELGEELLSNPVDRCIATINKLTYLNAVVMEALRVVTTIDSYQPRVVPAGGCSIEGYYLPGGTIVSSHPYLMNNHPAIFPSPKSFDPDRWLLSPEDYNALSKRLFTFSSGPRSCAGREFAIAMIKITVTEILLQFKTTLIPDSDKTWREGDEASKSEFYFRKAALSV